MRSRAELIELFRANGLRMTPQRECVFGVLGTVREHPTVEDIWSAAREIQPNVSRKTIYDIVHELVGVGALRPLTYAGGPARYEAVPSNHSHAVCESCGQIFNVALDVETPRVPESLARDFTIREAELVLYGLCKTCRQRTTK